MFLVLKNIQWREIDNKENRFYKPLLNAFLSELNRLNTSYPKVIPARLLTYMLGRNDFYKVISDDVTKTTKIQAFSLHGTLNRSAGKVKPEINLPQLIMPSRFLDVGYKELSNTTIYIICDQGWGISLRIHNASSMVEPSLKFDATLIGIPPKLYTHYESWMK